MLGGELTDRLQLDNDLIPQVEPVEPDLQVLVEDGHRELAAVAGRISVAPIEGAVLAEALDMGWADFEDAVSAAAAKSAGCQLIATRDPRGFKKSACPALAPQEALVAIRRLSRPDTAAP